MKSGAKRVITFILVCVLMLYAIKPGVIKVQAQDLTEPKTDEPTDPIDDSPEETVDDQIDNPIDNNPTIIAGDESTGDGEDAIAELTMEQHIFDKLLGPFKRTPEDLLAQKFDDYYELASDIRDMAFALDEVALGEGSEGISRNIKLAKYRMEHGWEYETEKDELVTQLRADIVTTSNYYESLKVQLGAMEDNVQSLTELYGQIIDDEVITEEQLSTLEEEVERGQFEYAILKADIEYLKTQSDRAWELIDFLSKQVSDTRALGAVSTEPDQDIPLILEEVVTRKDKVLNSEADIYYTEESADPEDSIIEEIILEDAIVKDNIVNEAMVEEVIVEKIIVEQDVVEEDTLPATSDTQTNQIQSNNPVAKLVKNIINFFVNLFKK